jgi:hypothetical protein
MHARAPEATMHPEASLLAVSLGEHLRQCDPRKDGSAGDRRPRAGAEQRASVVGGQEHPPPHAAEPLVGRIEEIAADSGLKRQLAHEDEHRHAGQRIAFHGAVQNGFQKGAGGCPIEIVDNAEKTCQPETEGHRVSTGAPLPSWVGTRTFQPRARIVYDLTSQWPLHPRGFFRFHQRSKNSSINWIVTSPVASGIITLAGYMGTPTLPPVCSAMLTLWMAMGMVKPCQKTEEKKHRTAA